MADKAHLTQLNQGVQVWNTWRNKNHGIQPDLREADLSGAYLDGLHLTGVDLTGVDFTAAHLTSADLRGAHLTGAHLNRTNLDGEVLTWCGRVAYYVLFFTQRCLRAHRILFAGHYTYSAGVTVGACGSMGLKRTRGLGAPGPRRLRMAS